MRTGRLIELVRRKFGDHGAEIMEILAVMGFATAHELEAQVLAVVDPTSGLTLMRFRVILGQMVSARYISAIREANFQSPFDSRHDTERFLRDQELLPTATSAKKSKVDADAVIDQELERRIDRTISAAAIDRELDTEPNQVNPLPPMQNSCTDCSRTTLFSPRTFRTSFSMFAMRGLPGMPRSPLVKKGPKSCEPHALRSIKSTHDLYRNALPMTQQTQ